MKTIPVSDLKRPSLHIVPIVQDDGSMVPGGHYWKAIEFTTKQPIKDVVGKYDVVQIATSRDVGIGSGEVWEFTDATIMLSPHASDFEQYSVCVLTYSAVKRVPT